MAKSDTKDLHYLLEKLAVAKRKTTSLHLLGVGRCENINFYSKFGITSFDSVSPFIQGTQHGEYHNTVNNEKKYTAIRVPQVFGNNKLRKKIASGQLDQDKLSHQEKKVLKLLKDYDKAKLKASKSLINKVLKEVVNYDEMISGKKSKHIEAYTRILQDRPWKTCKCALCKKLGINIVIMRGTERNKSRGFCNLNKLYCRVEERRRNGT